MMSHICGVVLLDKLNHKPQIWGMKCFLRFHAPLHSPPHRSHDAVPAVGTRSAYASPNAIPPAQTLVGFIISVVAEAAAWLTPTGCAPTRLCTPCWAWSAFPAPIRFATSSSVSGNATSRSSGVRCGNGCWTSPGPCLRWVSVWIWTALSSSAAGIRRGPSAATTLKERPSQPSSLAGLRRGGSAGSPRLAAQRQQPAPPAAWWPF